MNRSIVWRSVAFLFNSFLLLDAQSYVGSGSSIPIFQENPDRLCIEKGLFVADARSLCWYFQCQPALNDGGYKLVPKRCALGSYISEGFQQGKYNPCTERFPIVGIYECTRKNNTPNANCKMNLNCHDGTAKQEGTVCWCDCPLEFQGSPDCSKRRGPPPRPEPVVPCKKTDVCDKTRPCQNGGTCFDDCSGGYSCQCPVPFTKTKNCEKFNCAIPGFECPPPYTCTRGLNTRDEFYVCRKTDNCGMYIKPWPVMGPASD